MSIIINPPDFEDMMEIAESIRELSIEELTIKNNIKELEAVVTIKAIEEEKYFVNGKPPSMAFVSSTYAVTGFDGEITELRNKLVTVSAELEYQKNKFGIKKDMLEVWRTESANQRASVL